MLTRTSIPRSERELYSKLRQALARPGVLRGSLVEARLKCGKPSCRCHQQKRWRHPGLYLGLRLEGKQRMVYVPAAWHQRVREWTGRYQQIRQVLEQMCLACLNRLKARKE